MFTCSLTDAMLSREEQARFRDFLQRHGVDDAIWEPYARALAVSSPITKPMALRVFHENKLAGAAFVVKCKAYGRAMFDHPLLYRSIDLAGLPAFIWMRTGFCADLLANPGFIAEGFEEQAVLQSMLAELRCSAYGVIVTDFPANQALHGAASVFSYVKNGAVSLHGMHARVDFMGQHHRLRRKVQCFTQQGGEIEVVCGAMTVEALQAVRRCIDATVRESIIYTPFQDIFTEAALSACQLDSIQMVHAVARLHGEIVGYHTFVRSGRGLHMLHGAFDRGCSDLHHCYENVILAAVEYALEHQLECVHFGPILNETKRRMMNQTASCAIYFHSQYAWLRFLIPIAFRCSKMQSPKLLMFG